MLFTVPNLKVRLQLVETNIRGYPFGLTTMFLKYRDVANSLGNLVVKPGPAKIDGAALTVADYYGIFHFLKHNLRAS